jgi:nickel-type superoxide dismutase maturation protease
MRPGRKRDNGLIPLGIAVVSGVSMVPAYHDGDRLLVRYGGRVRTGDAVLARDPRLPERILVKRAAHREADGWWLLADNPYAPGDSRQFGAVPDELVLGRVLLRLRRARPGGRGAADENGNGPGTAQGATPGP